MPVKIYVAGCLTVKQEAARRRVIVQMRTSIAKQSALAAAGRFRMRQVVEQLRRDRRE